MGKRCHWARGNEEESERERERESRWLGEGRGGRW